MRIARVCWALALILFLCCAALAAGQAGPGASGRAGWRLESRARMNRTLFGVDAYKAAVRSRIRPATYVDVDLVLGAFKPVTWRGFGTSLGWFANFIGALPAEQLDPMMDRLFSPTRGLGLNIVRYILPGGLNPKLSPQLAPLVFQTVPGFKPTRNGPYNWSADAAQRNVLLGAMKRGADIAELVAYSPPWWQTISGDTAGNVGGAMNIRPRMFPFFVNYIADVVWEYKRRWGVTFHGVNPFNEPLATWWKKGGLQEGCGFDLRSIVQILPLMDQALKRRGLTQSKIVGIDEWAAPTTNAINKYPKIMDQYLERIAVHGYRLPTIVFRPSKTGIQDFINLHKVAAPMKKEVWNVEWGPFVSVPNNPTDLELALIQSRSIAEQINIFGLSAFVHWQVVAPSNPYLSVWPNPRRVGMIRLAFDFKAKFEPVYTKQYYSQLQYSRWIRPGAKFISVNGVDRFICVAYDQRMKRLVVVVTNQRTTYGRLKFHTQKGGVQVKSLDEKGLKANVYRTSATEDYKLAWTGIMGQTLESIRPVHILPNSITTFVFFNVEVK